MKLQFQVSATAIALALASGAATPAFAQAKADADASALGDIIVTAQRVEQRLQDVPISMTVFNPDQIAKRNIVVAADLAAYTPSLAVNSRYGTEKASFSLRGFNQDAATAPTVGVYFADVVGVRAQGGTTSGNSVGAGTFTDLQNVQVLKGPQGTLFGRNTTGGSILLVPAKPTRNLEGSVEGTLGNYNQRRIQAMVNIPLADTFRMRISVDRNKRDGFMINHSGVGPNDYNNTNYFYGRVSLVADLTPDLENYTIFHYSRSDTHGYASHYESCNTAITSPSAINPATGTAYGYSLYETAQAGCEQIARAQARGDGPHDVDVRNPDPRFLLTTWQAINTTTWRASDTLTVKNTASYGQFTEDSSFNLYSDNFYVANTPFNQALQTAGQIKIGAPVQYIVLDKQPGFHAAAESTFTEELQLQINSEKFNGVIGGYLEFSRPLGYNEQRTGIYGNCTDPGTLACTPVYAALSPSLPLPAFIISESRTKFNFNNHGIFAQGTYKFTDQFSVTGGLRYTFDKTVGYAESNRYIYIQHPLAGKLLASRGCNDTFNHPTVSLLTNGGDTSACGTTIVNSSNKPTWLIDVDYKPNGDMLFYAKYARGYRQGGINFTNPGLETWKPEKVDTFELGAKVTTRGAVPGYFNVAGFYNNFTDQQIFGGLNPKPGSGLSGGNAIINAGKSRIWGIEVDSGFTFAEHLHVTAGYTYLNTKLLSLVKPTLDPASPFLSIDPRGTVGGALTYSPKHRFTASAEYSSELGDGKGKVSVGAIFTHTASQIVDGNLSIPSTSLLDVNAGWYNVMESGIDIVGFASNVTDSAYKTTAGGGYASSGILDFIYGPPRMYGVRMKVKFGK